MSWSSNLLNGSCDGVILCHDMSHAVSENVMFCESIVVPIIFKPGDLGAFLFLLSLYKTMAAGMQGGIF